MVESKSWHLDIKNNRKQKGGVNKKDNTESIRKIRRRRRRNKKKKKDQRGQ